MCCTLPRYVGFLPWSEVPTWKRLVPAKAKAFLALGCDRFPSARFSTIRLLVRSWLRIWCRWGEDTAESISDKLELAATAASGAKRRHWLHRWVRPKIYSLADILGGL